MSKRSARRRLSAADLVAHVQAGKKAGFYLLYGEEGFDRERATDWLIQQLAPDAARDFNTDYLNAEHIQASDILSVYAAYPTLAQHRLLVLRRCEHLNAEACRQLEAMVDHPMETTIVIATATKVDMRRRLFQQLDREGLVVEFRTPYQEKLPGWIQSWARRAGGSIEPAAADMLALLIGRNLRVLAAEIEKALTFVGAGGCITPDAVRQVTGATASSSVFALADATGQGDMARSLALARQLVAHGEQPIHIVAMLARHYRMLLQARSLMDRGMRDARIIARELSISTFFVNGYMEQAQLRSPEATWRAIGALLQADSRLKSLGRRQGMLVLELLILDLCPVQALYRRA